MGRKHHRYSARPASKGYSYESKKKSTTAHNGPQETVPGLFSLLSLSCNKKRKLHFRRLDYPFSTFSIPPPTTISLISLTHNKENRPMAKDGHQWMVRNFENFNNLHWCYRNRALSHVHFLSISLFMQAGGTYEAHPLQWTGLSIAFAFAFAD